MTPSKHVVAAPKSGGGSRVVATLATLLVLAVAGVAGWRLYMRSRPSFRFAHADTYREWTLGGRESLSHLGCASISPARQLCAFDPAFVQRLFPKADMATAGAVAQRCYIEVALPGLGKRREHADCSADLTRSGHIERLNLYYERALACAQPLGSLNPGSATTCSDNVDARLTTASGPAEYQRRDSYGVKAQRTLSLQTEVGFFDVMELELQRDKLPLEVGYYSRPLDGFVRIAPVGQQPTLALTHVRDLARTVGDPRVDRTP